MAKWNKATKVAILVQIAREQIRDDHALSAKTFENWSIACYRAASKMRSHLYNQKVSQAVIDAARFGHAPASALLSK